MVSTVSVSETNIKIYFDEWSRFPFYYQRPPALSPHIVLFFVSRRFSGPRRMLILNRRGTDNGYEWGGSKQSDMWSILSQGWAPRTERVYLILYIWWISEYCAPQIQTTVHKIWWKVLKQLVPGPWCSRDWCKNQAEKILRTSTSLGDDLVTATDTTTARSGGFYWRDIDALRPLCDIFIEFFHLDDINYARSKTDCRDSANHVQFRYM